MGFHFAPTSSSSSILQSGLFLCTASLSQTHSQLSPLSVFLFSYISCSLCLSLLTYCRRSAWVANEAPSLVCNLGMGWSISGKWEGPTIPKLFPLFFSPHAPPLSLFYLVKKFEEIRWAISKRNGGKKKRERWWWYNTAMRRKYCSLRSLLTWNRNKCLKLNEGRIKRGCEKWRWRPQRGFQGVKDVQRVRVWDWGQFRGDWENNIPTPLDPSSQKNQIHHLLRFP